MNLTEQEKDEISAHRAVVDGMLDKALASEFQGQGSNPATRPTCEAGGLTYPVIQVYGRPSVCNRCILPAVGPRCTLE